MFGKYAGTSYVWFTNSDKALATEMFSLGMTTSLDPFSKLDHSVKHEI